MKIAVPASMTLVFCLALGATSDDSANPVGGMGLFPAAEIQWSDGPPSLQKGAQMAVLEGDPAKEGMFTMRLKLPADFDVKPHWHTQIEHVTVISGTLHFGMGETFDRAKTRAMPAGSFGYWPIGMRHFAYTEGETVLQLHGRGPWTITYVNPADDPRGRK
ncbi:MAG TPA: cupin domain-containing protein [Myxococcota bacterium]|nr:cupin domain-containing protein [Myxococcota bacterium]